jgi:hypothetical protein
MYDTLFTNRNKTIADLIKLGDCLGHSIRENVLLFKYTPQDNEISYITESGSIISGNYSIGDNITLKNITLDESSELFMDSKFNTRINEAVGSFMDDLFTDQMQDAGGSFSNILSLWSDRFKFNQASTKLEEKASKLAEAEKILSTEEFARLVEIESSLCSFLKENKELINSNSEIMSAIKLSNTISNAFNLPKKDKESLIKENFTFSDLTTGAIYDLICQQELVKKELLETKRAFSDSWTTKSKVNGFVNYLIEGTGDTERLCKLIAESIQEVPYFAMASKKQLTELLANLMEVRELEVNVKDIKSLSSQIFELKKPIREELVTMLSTKYGVQLQNLTEDISFKSLAQTQSLLLEALSTISQKGSVQKDVLSELSKVIKTKSGVECIDFSEYISDIFVKAGYKDFITESVSRYMNFDKVAGDLDRISGMLKMIMQKASSMAQQDPMGDPMGQDPMGQDPTQQNPAVQNPMEQDPMSPDVDPLAQEDQEGEYSADPEMSVPAKPALGKPVMGKPALGKPGMGKPSPGLPPEGPTDDFPGDTGAGVDAQEVPQEGGEFGAEEEEFSEMPGDPQAGGPVEISPEDIMGNVSELEELIASLKASMGGGDEEVIPGEEEEEEEPDLQ